MKKRIGLYGLLGIVCVLLVVRCYHEFVPRGGTRTPIAWFSRPGPKLVSPDGDIVLEVVFGDAGATHSGNFWTWVLCYSPFWGYRVVAEGYTGPLESYSVNPFPVTWIDNNTFEIDFLDGRRSETPVRQTVRLK